MFLPFCILCDFTDLVLNLSLVYLQCILKNNSMPILDILLPRLPIQVLTTMDLSTVLTITKLEYPATRLTDEVDEVVLLLTL